MRRRWLYVALVVMSTGAITVAIPAGVYEPAGSSHARSVGPAGPVDVLEVSWWAFSSPTNTSGFDITGGTALSLSG